MSKFGQYSKKQRTFFILMAFCTGLIGDYIFGHKLDFWVHDSAVVYQSRHEWNHTGIVVLDDGIPFSVGRKQTLPLFARAVDRLVEAGAKGVFLDARIPKELEGRMPYAQCIKTDGSVQWSVPDCRFMAANQCQLQASELGQAPLKMSVAAIQYFRLAPYLNQYANDLPDFLLFGWEAAEAIPKPGLVVSDRLVTYDSPIARWVDLSHDHAVYQLIQFIKPDTIDALFKDQATDDLCQHQFPCRRIRLSLPVYHIQTEGSKLILPVSQLASCDRNIGLKLAKKLKDKLVILQTVAPNESTDLVLSPMTTALLGPHLMTPGAQYLLDEIETLLNQDSPRPPPDWLKIMLFLIVASFGVWAGLRFTQFYLWLTAVLLGSLLIALCFFYPVIQLWPVMATLWIYLIAAGQSVVVLLIAGKKQGSLLRRYVPEKIIEIVLPLGEGETFLYARSHVVVLMSDLAGYTTVTGLLAEPRLVLELMNDYLGETSRILEKKYDGILEAYVGDLVCYYWDVKEESDPLAVYQRSLQATLELRKLQKRFFKQLPIRYADKIDLDSLQKIANIIDAGIGVTAGYVVKGEVGPEQEFEKGLKKPGILGDPLNLAARIESLTRLFSTDIIIGSDFLPAVENTAFTLRRLGTIKVKGRVQPETLYALGWENDPVFESTIVADWEQWLDAIESRRKPTVNCPDCFKKDQQTIEHWLARGLLGIDGIWALDKK